MESHVKDEASLLAQGIEALSGLLGPGWRVARSPAQSQVFDALLTVEPDGGDSYTEFLVEAVRAVPPRYVQQRLAPKAELLREVNSHSTMLVVAPWISTIARDLLRRHQIAYLDLTGNVDIRVSHPAIIIHTDGAEKDRRPAVRGTSQTTLAGAKAGRLVRLLADVEPPHRASDLHQASALSLPYVSRLLGTLEDQLLIRRSGRTITAVDWPQLLRARSQVTKLLGNDSYLGFLAPNGLPSVLNRMPQAPARYVDGLSVTGSFAAQRFVHVAVGGQLMLYVAPWLDPVDVADELGLLPVTEGADVLLLKEPDEFVRQGSEVVDGVQYVAPSQAALDCLAGPGRMPAEGEALLDFMEAHPQQWRVSWNAPGAPYPQH